MDAALSEQNQKIAHNIEKHGWHCLHVAPCEDGEEPFTYSIGFAQSYGAPEVMIFGLAREKSVGLLNACASALRDGHAINPEVEDPELLSGGYAVISSQSAPSASGSISAQRSAFIRASRLERLSCSSRTVSIAFRGKLATATFARTRRWPSSNNSFKPTPSARLN